MTDDQNDRLDVPFSHDSLGETGNTAAIRINEVAEAFEQAWRTGSEPNLDEYLRNQDVDRQQLLLELIRVDLEQRWRQGEPLRIEAYLSRYPELANKPADVVDLLDWECRMRRMLAQQVEVREYRKRFPHHFAALMRRMGEPATVQPTPLAPPAAIRLNCPHCRDPIEFVAEQADEIVCPSCGSSFRVDNDRTQTWSKDKLPKLGKFELLTRLGMGAFGTVYKAHDSELKRTVAVKLPRSGTAELTDTEGRLLRGGSFHRAGTLHSAFRYRFQPSNRIFNVGFRAARTYHD
jgi:hypothetical protein